MGRNNTKRALFILAIILALVTSGCDKPKETPAPEQKQMSNEHAGDIESAQAVSTLPQTTAVPDIVSFTKVALYPEGVDYDVKGKRFLVTSLREGIIGEVKDDGTYQVVIQDPNMVSAVGIRIDADRDRVLVCNSDPGVSVHTKKETQGKLAGVGVFVLSTGMLIKYLDLGVLTGGGHFCNDIALDSTGNAYVTDSFSPIIYKIDVHNNVSILLNNERFKGDGFNLNGIVVKDGYLVVAKHNEGMLFKVPLDDPSKFTQVKLQKTMPGADGLLWTADGALVVIANSETNKVFKLTSTDDWASASIVNSVATGPVFPTTGVTRNGGVYVLNAMLHVLFNPETKSHVEKFEIRKYML